MLVTLLFRGSWVRGEVALRSLWRLGLYCVSRVKVVCAILSSVYLPICLALPSRGADQVIRVQAVFKPGVL